MSSERTRTAYAFEPFAPAEVEQSIPARFRAVARRHAARPAVIDAAGRVVDYAALDGASSALAHAILERRGDGEEPVALVLCQGVDAVAAILGALKAGKIYVPLDATWPARRLADVLDDVAPGLILADAAGRAALAGARGPEVLAVDGLPATAARDPELTLAPGRGAYVYYTSGSTGRPKGVLDCHRNVLHNVLRYTNQLAVGPDDRLSLLQSPGFSGAVSSLFTAILNGAAACPLDLAAAGADAIGGWLRDRGVTIYHSVPALFRAAVAAGGEWPALRVIRLEGDRASTRDVETFRRHFPAGCVFANGLGATECGLISQFFLDGSAPIPAGPVPIGTPVPGMGVCIVDGDGSAVEAGRIGEIEVRSRYLALGYWGQPELTRARFLPDPAGDGVRRYRTGDLGRRREDGLVEHLGRADGSVKLRGERVDVVEIETALLEHPAVAEAAAAVRADDPEAPRLVAHVVPRAGAHLTVSGLRRLLSERLPAALVPSAYVLLERLPLDANGKVDRRALPPPGAARPEQDRLLVPPRDATEARVASVWASLLGLERVGVEDDFMDLGGDSLLATRIATRLRVDAGIDVSAAELLAAGTVAAVAARAGAAVAAAGLGEALGALARRDPHAIAVVAPGRPGLTRAGLAAQVDQVRAVLRACGVGPQGRVGISVGSSAESLVALTAVASSAVALPLDNAWRRGECEAVLKGSGVEVLVAPRDGANGARAAAAALGIAVLDLSAPVGAAAGGVTLAGGRDGAAAPEVPRRPADLALLLHTSGTTGRPRRVPLSHGNVAASAAGLAGSLGLGPADRALALMPLSHVHGIMVAWAALLAGGSVACPGALDPDRFLGWLAELRPTWYSAVPAVHRAVVSAARRRGPSAAAAALRVVRSSSAPLPPALAAEIEAALGVPVVEAYGMTEAAHQIASSPLPPAARRPGSVGRPTGGEVRIADASGRPLPPEVTGQVLVRGPAVTAGYESDAAATAEAFVDGWLRTGDLGHLDADGCLYLTGRIKELINRGGEKIAPREVEDALGGHPALAECAVFSAPHETLGEDVAAAVVLRAGAVAGDAELREHVGMALSPSKVPARILRLSALPRGRTGKVDRGALVRALEAAGREPGLAVAPRTATQAVIAAIWAEVLGRAAAGIDDSFFALGGDSLRATMIASRMIERLRVSATAAVVLERATIAELASWADTHPRDARAGAPAAETARAPTAAVSPMSFGQERLWFLHQLAPAAATYNVPLATRLRGALDAAALARALRSLVERHEALRTTYAATGDGPVQEIGPPDPVPVRRVDLADGGGRAGAADVEARLRALAREPFDLTRDAPLRADLLRVGADEHVLLLTFHHIAVDGGSLDLICADLAALYRQHLAGGVARLPAPPPQYREHAAAQRAGLTADVIARERAFWRDRLAGAPAELRLPVDAAHGPGSRGLGGRRRAVLPEATAAGLRALARARGASPFMAWLAAFEALLARWTGEDDLIVGIPVSGRESLGSERLVGFLVNTVPVRARLDDDPSFAALLARSREAVLDALAHQALPFERVVDAVAAARVPGRLPLVQVTFAMERRPGACVALDGLDASPVEVDTGAARFDLSVTVEEGAGQTTALVEYDADLFAPAAIDALLARWPVLLNAVIAGPDRPLSAAPWLPDAERHRIAEEWNATARPFPGDRGLADLFAEQARRCPDAVAVSDGDTRLSYAVLDLRAERLSARLRALGVTPDAAVAVCLPRGIDLVVALVAVAKAGAAYVPLDPGHPVERRRVLIEDAGAVAVVAAAPAASAPGAGAADAGVPVVAVDAGAEEDRAAPARPAAGGDHLAYVMYTSGSTGRPKGVAVSQRAVIRLATNTDYLSIGRADVVAQAASAAFDASTFEIWSALLNGARLAVLATDVVVSPRDLGAAIAREGITVLFLTTALASAVAREAPEAVAPLRALLFGGEAVDARCARRLVEHGMAGRLLHVYGPTETTTFATWERVDAVPVDAATVPIGRPIANTTVYLLDRRGALVPPGTSGGDPRRRARGGAGLRGPARSHRGALRARPVLRIAGRATVPDRRSRSLPSGRPHRVPRAARPPGEDPRPPDRAGRDGGRARRAAGRARRRGRRPRGCRRRAGPGRLRRRRGDRRARRRRAPARAEAAASGVPHAGCDRAGRGAARDGTGQGRSGGAAGRRGARRRGRGRPAPARDRGSPRRDLGRAARGRPRRTPRRLRRARRPLAARRARARARRGGARRRGCRCACSSRRRRWPTWPPRWTRRAAPPRIPSPRSIGVRRFRSRPPSCGSGCSRSSIRRRPS